MARRLPGLISYSDASASCVISRTWCRAWMILLSLGVPSGSTS
jgi:hypothetical protein